MKSEEQVLTELALGEFHFYGGCPWVKPDQKLTKPQLEKLADALKAERHERDPQLPLQYNHRIAEAVFYLMRLLNCMDLVDFRFIAKFESLAELASFLDYKAVKMTSRKLVCDTVGDRRKEYIETRFGKMETPMFGKVDAFQNLEWHGENPGTGDDGVGG